MKLPVLHIYVTYCCQLERWKSDCQTHSLLLCAAPVSPQAQREGWRITRAADCFVYFLTGWCCKNTTKPEKLQYSSLHYRLIFAKRSKHWTYSSSGDCVSERVIWRGITICPFSLPCVWSAIRLRAPAGPPWSPNRDVPSDDFKSSTTPATNLMRSWDKSHVTVDFETVVFFLTVFESWLQ